MGGVHKIPFGCRFKGIPLLGGKYKKQFTKWLLKIPIANEWKNVYALQLYNRYEKIIFMVMSLSANITREGAWELLKKYNSDPFHLEHGEIVENTLRYFARELGYGEDEEFWGIVGLLHDLDFEQWPEQHCIKERELMQEAGLSEELIHATTSHGWAITVDVKPEHEMEKVLYAVDELTGLIGAVVLMRPSKSVQDLELKSVLKKYKSPKFAAGCSREVIERGANLLGWELNDLISRTIAALKTFRP